MTGRPTDLLDTTPAGDSTRWMWVRWSWRDLRANWVAVAAIALVMAIGVGVYSGLGSTASWRRQSNDASFAAQRMHDYRITLSPGTFIRQGALVEAVMDTELRESLQGSEERLVVDSQIDATTDSDVILVAARLVGMDLSAAEVDRLWVSRGSVPDEPSAQSRLAGILEVKFADFWSLGTTGTFSIGAGFTIDYAGVGAIPEDFYYEGPDGSVFGQGELAPVYVSLIDAQRIAGRRGDVNDLVVTIADSADEVETMAVLRRAVDELGVSATIETRDDATAVRVLYDDIDTDQRFWNALAGLILGAAALAAFNLIHRIVEAQRREIGIGLSLGVGRPALAVRPLLVGAQVAVLGSIAGVGVGVLMGDAMADLLRSFLPLPDYRTPFQPGVFARGAAFALAIPMLAAAIPTWRAVTVEPIEAIRTGHLTAASSRLTDWTGRLRLPGSSLTQMPIRNLLRTPRRTMLTALGVGAAITALVAVLAMLDSFSRTVDVISDELTRGDAEQVLVQFDTFESVESDVVAAVRDVPAVGALDPSLRLPVSALGDRAPDQIDLLVEFLDLDADTWTPSITPVPSAAGAGIVLAEKAADDLRVAPGDSVMLRFPARRDDGSFTSTVESFRVAGTHPNPMRVFAYMDSAEASRFGLGGLVNTAHVYPADGSSRADVQRALFGMTGVSTTQAATRIAESFDDALDQFVGLLVIASVAVLVLALLIAFNASRITIDERRREHATMRAFGVPVRSIVGVVVKESVLVGCVATVVGLVAGVVFLDWMIGSLASTTLPDLGIIRRVAPSTVVIAAAVGIAAVAIAPLFLVRRISRMDIPDTLRVME